MPIDIPFSGLLLGCETPSIVTLFGMNVVPFGIGSVSTIFVEGTVPLFCKLIVYVIISPMSTKVRLADFVGLTVAVLTATVDFAMLVWQGTLSATVTETVVNNNIPTFQTPDGVIHTITNVPSWGETRSSGTFQGTIYTRAANVTSILQGLSNRAKGDYFVERIPTANPPAQGTGVGWALVVVYRDNSYPIRNVSLYTGLLISTLTETLQISNFITPSIGPVNARLFTMALNGDTDATGDRFNLNGTGLSGPNNLINNFFASQVNNYLGNLDVVGSFGDRNMPIGTAATNRRAEFDVTNVPANGVLTAGSTSTTVNVPNTFDYNYVGAVGLQIDLAEARLTATKSVTVS
ncbi:hypothetical protein AN402_3578 [Bacillus wiedmannii]|nr:hypothetical protein AN402_3578 [Bacillus wiedmannii]